MDFHHFLMGRFALSTAPGCWFMEMVDVSIVIIPGTTSLHRGIGHLGVRDRLRLLLLLDGVAALRLELDRHVGTHVIVDHHLEPLLHLFPLRLEATHAGGGLLRLRPVARWEGTRKEKKDSDSISRNIFVVLESKQPLGMFCLSSV